MPINALARGLPGELGVLEHPPGIVPSVRGVDDNPCVCVCGAAFALELWRGSRIDFAKLAHLRACVLSARFRADSGTSGLFGPAMVESLCRTLAENPPRAVGCTPAVAAPASVHEESQLRRRSSTWVHATPTLFLSLYSFPEFCRGRLHMPPTVAPQGPARPLQRRAPGRARVRGGHASAQVGAGRRQPPRAVLSQGAPGAEWTPDAKSTSMR